MFFGGNQLKFLRKHHIENRKLILFRYKKPRSKKWGHLRIIGGVKYDDSYCIDLIVVADVIERTNRTYKGDYLKSVISEIESFLDGSS